MSKRTANKANVNFNEVDGNGNVASGPAQPGNANVKDEKPKIGLATRLMLFPVRHPIISGALKTVVTVTAVGGAAYYGARRGQLMSGSVPTLADPVDVSARLVEEPEPTVIPVLPVSNEEFRTAAVNSGIPEENIQEF